MERGGDQADNGFISDGNGRSYWPIYWRGILLGGVMPYNSVNFGPGGGPRSSAVQVVNGPHTPNEPIIKVARHNDGKLHGWVPGDVQVRWELRWNDVQRAIITQAPREMRRNNNDTRSSIVW